MPAFGAMLYIFGRIAGYPNSPSNVRVFIFCLQHVRRRNNLRTEAF
jgi:hypothetical protein